MDRINEQRNKLAERLAVKPSRAAVLLDCSRTKIYQAINSGAIRSVRIAGMLRVPIAEIERQLAHAAPERESR